MKKSKVIFNYTKYILNFWHWQVDRLDWHLSPGRVLDICPRPRSVIGQSPFVKVSSRQFAPENHKTISVGI